VALGRLRTDATRGYLGFTAIVAALLGLLALGSDNGLPLASVVTSDPAWDAPRRTVLAAFCVLAFVYGVVVARGGRSPVVAGAGLLAGALVLLLAGLSWGGGPLGIALLTIQLAALSAALGGVWASMILGHWYLVTPKLAEAPLILFARVLAIVVAVQLGLFVVWLAVGAGPSGEPGFAALGGSSALFVWLRLIVGLAFPLVISWAAIQTAKTRSMESATGLLYIDVAAIAASTIVAAGLYFGAGLLV
ncbi:MAG TPA: hypothetical protein VF484_01220, partial [Candidatus Limnocylindrales bacterium]